MYAIQPNSAMPPPPAGTQPSSTPFVANSGPAPRVPKHPRKRARSPLQPAMRRAITLDTLRQASQLLVYESENTRTCARRYGLSERDLRSLVKPDGRLTAVGRRIDNGELVAPGDRDAASLSTAGKTTLAPEDFALADRLLGQAFGKMTRTLFCDLFGYDHGTVFRAYGKDGKLTAWGREQRDAACAQARQAAASSLDEAAAAANGTRACATPSAESEAAEQRAAEQRLSALATREGIAIGYWSGTQFRRLGRPGAGFCGDVDKTEGQWRIRPATGGEYRLAPGPRQIDHIVNILRLRAQGAPELTASYDFEQSYDGRIVLVTPRPDALPADPAPDAAQAS